MRMKSEGFGSIEIAGDITSLKQSEGYLIMNVNTSTPVGWHVRAALTHKDLMTILKQMLKPGNLLYLLFGFGRPRNTSVCPDY